MDYLSPSSGPTYVKHKLNKVRPNHDMHCQENRAQDRTI